MCNEILTGYPSIDKPWLKYYDINIINQILPQYSMFDYIFQNNQGYYDNVALEYYGQTITYGTLFSEIEKIATSLASIGVKQGDIVSFLAITTPEIVFSIYAVNYLGAICNMIDPRMSEEMISNIFSNTDSRHLILLDIFSDKISMSNIADHCDIILLSDTSQHSSSSNIKQKHIPFRHISWEKFVSHNSPEHQNSKAQFSINCPALIE